jgi:hypothetical protein
VRVLAPKPVSNSLKDPKLQAFQDAVKHAERSTLIHNLDLGSKKTLNEHTILSKATLALSAAAATVEGNHGKSPSKEAVSALDDVFSVTQNVTLFGRVTRPYENKMNKNDPKNRTFFTLPVRYEFKDRDTRVEAETILRETCKVECTTPYPTILRHCIKKVVEHFREEFPGDYIRTTVDPVKLKLKVTRKVRGHGWYQCDDPISLPKEVLDIKARAIPDDFVMPPLPIRRRKPSSTTASEMEVGHVPVNLDIPEIPPPQPLKKKKGIRGVFFFYYEGPAVFFKYF